MSKKNLQMRQGDVWVEGVDGIPTDVKLKKATSPIVAHGEVTGHCHQIASPSLDKMELYINEDGSLFYARSEKEPIVLVHDEHGSVEIPAGQTVKINIQREFDASAFEAEEEETERRVRD